MDIKTLRQVCKSHNVVPPFPWDEEKSLKDAARLIAAMQWIASWRR